MPIYEFECPRCDLRFEELIRTSRRKKPPCPECGCAKPQRVMSGFAMGGRAESSAAAGGSSCNCAGCGASSCAGCSH